MSWNESRTACFNDGMDLAVISDYDVLREVQGFLEDKNYYRYVYLIKGLNNCQD